LLGQGQQDIKDDMNRGYEKMVAHFQNLDRAKLLKRRLEDDLKSVSEFGGRRSSFSNETDAGLPMRRYLQDDPGQDALTVDHKWVLLAKPRLQTC
jgi:hypothetical protein